MAEGGLSDYEVMSWNGLAAPARTPEAIVALPSQHVNEAARMPNIEAATAKLGMEACGSTVSELRQHFAADVAKWANVIEAAGIAKK